jgi:sulfite reductase (NADPH) flavoprotein alpha-component
VTAGPGFSVIVGYGTDMGSAEDAAMSFAEAFQDATGIAVQATELNQVNLADLQSVTHFIAVTSTFGDGEFPDTAALFWEALSADSAGRLDQLSFAVLALGDSIYDLFCNAGRLLDERLEFLGATRLAPRVDIDGAYRQHAASWTSELVKLLTAAQPTDAVVPVVPEPSQERAERSGHHHDQPVPARITVNRLLTAPESDKEVRHYEVDLAGSGITYDTGDSIAVHASNDPALVEAMLAEFGVAGDHEVDGHEVPLRALLTEHLEIRTPTRALRALVAGRLSGGVDEIDIGGDAPGSWWYGKDVLDLIRLADLSLDEVIDTLRPLQPRDYSIASSPLLHPDRVHLTVATVRYRDGDRRHGGVASTFLADRAETVKVHLRPNDHFRLPAADVPIIMIGPGTGIAPFRAFLQERQAMVAPGRSWLFFGDRRRATDFLYGDELEGFLEAGTLTRLDLAFSRDGEHSGAKRYVQHCMWESSAELFDWIQDGAQIYVCGDADRMAKDVDAALHDIVARCGRMDAATAHAYVNDLIRNHRYLRDIY